MQTQSPEINSLLEALSKAQSEIGVAKTDSSNPHFRSKYADLTSIWEAARGSLTKNGLSVIQSVEIIETGQMCLSTILGHRTGQWIKSLIPMNPIKPDPQTMGALITYYRRYTLAAMVGICPEDDDGEKATQPYRENDSYKESPKRNADNAPASKPKEAVQKIAQPIDEGMPIDPFLNAVQCENLERLIGDDYAYKKAMLKNFKVEFVEELPQSQYDYIFDRVKGYMAQKEAKKNVGQGPSVFTTPKIQELKL